MTNIINIEERDGKQAVSARELYSKLGLDLTNWSRWAKKNIEKNEFAIDGQDYQGFVIMTSGNETKDYALTIDFAKKLCMLARTIAGEKIRQYFIDVEKNYIANINTPLNYLEALKQLVAKEEEKQLLLQQNNNMKHKAEFYDAVTGASTAISIGECAKVLNMGIGQNKLFAFLRDKNILMHNNIPYQSYQDQGWFRVIEQKYTKPNGETHINLKTVVFQKGVDGIRKLLEKEVN
jgi:anti-repressor protein